MLGDFNTGCKKLFQNAIQAEKAEMQKFANAKSFVHYVFGVISTGFTYGYNEEFRSPTIPIVTCRQGTGILRDVDCALNICSVWLNPVIRRKNRNMISLLIA